MKIRARAILVIILTNFTIILLSILAGTGYVRENIENYIEADMLVVADIADRFISSELDLLKYEAEAAATEIAESDSADFAAIMSEHMRQYPQFIGMAVMDRNSGTVASAGEWPAVSDILENEYIQEAFSGKTSFTSTIPTDNGVMFYLAAPISGMSERILAIMLDGMYFSDLASEYHVWESGHIFIDDSEGYIIANIRPEWVQNRQNFIIQAQNDPQYEPVAAVIRKLIVGERGIAYYSVDDISRICAYRPISGSEEGWCLGIVAPLSESPVKNVDRGLLLIAFIGFLLNVVAAIIASNFIRKPFEEVAALREAAEADSHAKSDFLAHMSHEIRTPLNAVIGLSGLTLGDANLNKEAESNLEKIYGAGATILSIVNDILDISKIESGRFELNPVKYDTPSLINDTVTLNAVRIGEKPVVFKIDVDENLPESLHGDDLRVKQIFNNILSNAFKYTHAGTVEWRMAFERDGGHILLISDVRDTGIGINPEDLEDLFSDYKQVNMNANRKVEGTGLGLAITKRLVELMDGVITVESEYGKGTTFHVRIRQALVSDRPIGKEVADNLMDLHYSLSKRAKNRKLAKIDLSYAHVLIVDDIATNLDVVKGMMKPYGVKIDCAGSGRQAIEMIRAGQPRYNAVFMDHMMPDIDGIEATRIIREEIGTDYAANVPIIALTANAIVGNEEMFLNKGFQAFISKPIEMIKLDAALRSWVRNKALEEEFSGMEKEVAETERTGSERGSFMPGTDEIAGIDMRKALAHFGGDKAVLTDVLRSYAANTPTLISRLREYLAVNDLDDYAIVIHGIKGSSYGIFAEEAGRAAEALETAAKAKSFDALHTGHAAFEKLAESLLNALNRALSEIDDDTDKPIAAEPDPALLKELREACEVFDMDRVDTAMARLTSFRYERGEKLVAWLREQAINMAFEEISGGDWPTD